MEISDATPGIDPQTQVQFYACPATGEASWDPPAGHFVYALNFFSGMTWQSQSSALMSLV